MKRFKNIVYVVSGFSLPVGAALQTVRSLVTDNQATLTLVHVHEGVRSLSLLERIGLDHDSFEAELKARQEKVLADISEEMGVNICSRHITLHGKPAVVLSDLVATIKADLVIKSCGPSSVMDRFAGADDIQILRLCPCPVWLLSPEPPKEQATIVAAIDFDTDPDSNTGHDSLSDIIVTLALSLASNTMADLHIINAYEVPEAGFISLWVEEPEKIERELEYNEYQRRRSKMDALLKQLRERIGDEAYDFIAPQSHVLKGRPSEEIVRLVKNKKADLVVMGTVARTGVAGVLIGNTAEMVLSQLPCSVLAVKPSQQRSV
jgi:nucleotide-binding universal stress UspA family protein